MVTSILLMYITALHHFVNEEKALCNVDGGLCFREEM